MPDNKLIAIALSDAFDLGILSSAAHVAWSIAAGSTLEDRPVYVKTTCFKTFPFPDDDTGLTPELHQRIAALAEQIDAHRKRALTPTLSQREREPELKKEKTALTLTGMYNVLEILRQAQDERVLTVKEKAIHTQGLVSVLKDLHDHLDAAVLAAYGLAETISNDALLTHVVALSAQRAQEEKAGKVRWLRPEFQNPALKAAANLLSKQEPFTHVFIGLQADLIPENEPNTEKLGKKDAKTAAQTWPNALPAQVSAVAQLLASAGAALSLAGIEASFKSKGPWKKGLPRILETLKALGRARREGDGWRW